MRRDVILVGGGGHARVVGEAILGNRDALRLIGFVDPKPSERTAVLLGVDRLGLDEELSNYPDALLALGVGRVGRDDPRPALLDRIGSRIWATVIHPSAHVSPTAKMGRGAVILPRAVVHAGAHFEEHVLVNSGAIVEHDVTVGRLAVVGPGAIIGGGAGIGDHAFIGLGAVIRDNIRLGTGCVVGMGAVVTRNVAAGAVVTGVPARIR